MSDLTPGASAADRRRIRVLWNPTAGRKGGVPTNRASRELLLDLMARHGLGEELLAPSSEADAIDATVEAVRSGYDVVVGAGGDGTIGLIGRHLIGSETALGILPFGSVMNIARMLGVPRDHEGAARVLAEGHLRTIDVGVGGGDCIFYEAASVGFAAAATRELPKVDRGDDLAIVRSVVAVFQYRPTQVRIELDQERTMEAKAVAIAVSNGPYIGPGLPVAPEASLDDGLFDVRVFLSDTNADRIRSVANIIRRRPHDRRSLSSRAAWVRITSARPLPARADAVDLGTTPVVFEIRPRVLTVVAPPPSGSSIAGYPRVPQFRVPILGGGAAGSDEARDDRPRGDQEQQPQGAGQVSPDDVG